MAAIGRDARFRWAEVADAAVRQRPAPDVWSPIEYLAHLRDVSTFFGGRIERVLTEHRPDLAVEFRFADLADERRYRDEDPAAVLDALTATTTAVADRLRSLAPADWDRVGTGSGSDERSVLTLARRLAHEGRHHLQDLSRAAAGGPDR